MVRQYQKAAKWLERKEAVAELTKLASTKKIAPGDFTEICRTLKKIITDVNIAVAVEAIQAVGNLARGLRTHFSGNSRMLLPILQEKLKEKKPTLTEALTQTLQAMHKAGCLNLADIVEGKECTYSNSYTKRQAIFSCLTCTPDGNAGVCTACSLSCHDGHEVLELWTKRNFRCDCGNSKFGEFFCKLSPNKDIENGENSYNHNFKGVCCTCGRPYPDPEVEEQEEMIQCCICEDWFHEEHLNLESADEALNDVIQDDEDPPKKKLYDLKLSQSRVKFDSTWREVHFRVVFCMIMHSFSLTRRGV